jgi:aminopeptidase N
MSDARYDQAPKTIHLQDYQPPAFLIDAIDLQFELSEEHAVVTARSRMQRAAHVPADAPLVLDGQGFTLETIALDGRALESGDYAADSEKLTIARVPASFTLDVRTRLRPQDNTALEGLYKSGGNFCTQCEAEGFRRITYYLDRPDVLARYTVTIVADKSRYPVLLANGNRVDQGDVAEGRHWVRWEDPFPKPSYLFAMVAGDLACIADEFVTRSGRRVALRIYVQYHNVDKCEHAMRSLKSAMRWDEQRFGREYDLDVYMIVAVDDFNMGAMENKGLNIFNSRYVLAKPETATDGDYQAIEGVIGHEYFHNWSGNRVTCRDWFQLSLKEGFTVFRDQEFSGDLNSRAVKRIADVNVLRTHQFREDAGPMAHPVRPASYVEINNFYTLTVYNKGAEVIRMMHTILGEERFRRGCDLYFSRHDGQAVTTDDFVRALEDASAVDLVQFRRWYDQAGTPVLKIDRHYDAIARSYTLTIRQSCPPTPDQPNKQPFHVPLVLGLLAEDGGDLPLQLRGESAPQGTVRVLQLTAAQETFTFVNVPHEPVPSLLRGFSAPVKLDVDLSDAERCFLMAHDGDAFNRWDAGQQLAVKVALELTGRIQSGRPLELDANYVRAVRHLLEDAELDPAFVALALTLPAETYIAESMDVIDPDAVHGACRFMRRALAEQLADVWRGVYERNRERGDYRIDARAMGRRSLANVALGYLMELNAPETRAICMDRFRNGGNMTDVLSALAFLVNNEGTERDVALAEFYARWRDEALVVDKWFAIQAASRLPDTLGRVQELARHDAFNLKNPNRARALIGTFTQGNHARFHDRSGAGYALLGDFVLALDALNPQVAARLAGGFTTWRRYDAARQALMARQLERIRDHSGLSKDVYEVVSKTLA